MNKHQGKTIAICIFLALGCIWLALLRLKQVAHVDSMCHRLRSVFMALEIFQENHCRLPGNFIDNNGSPLTSWRVELLPYTIGVKHEYNTKSPWEDPENAVYRKMVHSDYCNETIETCIIGAMGWDSSVCDVQELSDLPSSMVILIAVPQTRYHWMEPGDGSISSIVGGEFWSDHDEIAVGFADGVIWILSGSCRRELLPFLDASVAGSADRESLLLQYRIKECKPIKMESNHK